MSRDQMQDVFPIGLDYEDGEQPSSIKKTAVVKHTDSAFSNVTRAIGDPWDFQVHSVGKLSLENLTQSSLARLIGPSDWISPVGGCWNERKDFTTVTLKQERNSWSLGFPLVKVTTPIEEASIVSNTITSLSWDTEVVVITDINTVLTSQKDAAKDVVADGDFYVDFYKGTITAYKVSSNDIVLRFINLHMFGSGVPWATHNVIPTWKSTVNLCNVTKVIDVGDQSQYTLTLPIIDASPRIGTHLMEAGKRSYASSDCDVAWWGSSSGLSTQYRIPSTLTTAGLSVGAEIPDGYFLLWDDDGGRVVPLVTFKYKDENSVTLETSQDWLNEGDNYRLITSGSSLSEAVSYLFETTRNNNSVGLIDSPTVSYSPPISHDNLENRFTAYAEPTGISLSDELKFRESDYPTNCHPQYLHRYGYMASDSDGNTANAMRGNLVFANTNSVINTLMTSSYIAFGHSTKNTIGWQGAVNDTAASGASGVAANRFCFSLSSTGANPELAPTGTGYLGAITIEGTSGAPLYIRGTSGYEFQRSGGGPWYRGATIGMDLGHRSEANYIKLLPGYRIGGDHDVRHMPANTGQTSTSTLDITPSLASGSNFHRLSPHQIREFRFRGVPNVENATNTSDSIGDDSGISEFDYYFTSPGVVGADFFNVYSNAIFFSDTGDGRKTSFTENGYNWLNDDTNRPSGIYFRPDGIDSNYLFTIHETAGGYASRECLTFGYNSGFSYSGASFDVDTTTCKIEATYLGHAQSIEFVGRNINIVHTNESFGASPIYPYDPVYYDSTITIGLSGESANITVTHSTPTDSGVVNINAGDGEIIIDDDGVSFPNIEWGFGNVAIFDGTVLKLQTSTIKYKENVEDIEDYEWIYKTKPRTFRYTFNEDSPTVCGFILEELQALNSMIAPKGVGMYDTIGLIAVLTKAVQEQKKEIDELRTLIGQ
jgi:hypothetical protein